jgi:hypothetical protein
MIRKFHQNSRALSCLEGVSQEGVVVIDSKVECVYRCWERNNCVEGGNGGHDKCQSRGFPSIEYLMKVGHTHAESQELEKSSVIAREDLHLESRDVKVEISLSLSLSLSLDYQESYCYRLTSFSAPCFLWQWSIRLIGLRSLVVFSVENRFPSQTILRHKSLGE